MQPALTDNQHSQTQKFTWVQTYTFVHSYLISNTKIYFVQDISKEKMTGKIVTLEKYFSCSLIIRVDLYMLYEFPMNPCNLAISDKKVVKIGPDM